MTLERNQYESVRYQLKKLVGEETYKTSGYTNEEIRIAAEDVKPFEALTIANRVLANRTTQLAKQEKEEQIQALTVAQKHSLTKMQADFMGITLSENEIQKIASSANNEITDNIEFLLEVKQLIEAYLAHRNEQFQKQTSNIVQDIADVINAGNDELARITEETNETLRDIVSQCEEIKRDYKSPYKDRLESIRELLKVS